MGLHLTGSSVTQLNNAYARVVTMTGTPATDTAAIQAAINAGGRILINGGSSTWTVNQLLIKTGAFLDLGGCTLKLANGQNVDLVTVPSFATLTGGNTGGGEKLWAITNGTLDGNRANQTAGWTLRAYGCAYSIDGLTIQGGKDGCAYTEWGNAAATSGLTSGMMEATWRNVRVLDSGTHGLVHNGPHDSTFINLHIVSASSGPAAPAGSRGLWAYGNAGGDSYTNIHVWGGRFETAGYIDQAARFTECYFEGATVTQLDVRRANVQGSVWLYNSSSQAANTLLAVANTVSGTDLRVHLDSVTAACVPLSVGTGGRNVVRGTWKKSSTTTLLAATPQSTDRVDIICVDDLTGTYRWDPSLDAKQVAASVSAPTIKTVGVPFVAGLYYTAPATGVTTNIFSEGVERGIPIVVGRDCTLTRIGLEVTVVGTAGAVVRLGVYLYDPTADSFTLLVDAGTIDGTSATYQEKTISQAVTAGQVIVPTATDQGAAGTRPTVRAHFAASTGFPQVGVGVAATLSAASSPAGFSFSSVSGALPSTRSTVASSGTIATGIMPRVLLKAS